MTTNEIIRLYNAEPLDEIGKDCVIININKKYNAENALGLELGGIFWHFVDILWIYLFFFFYLVR